MLRIMIGIYLGGGASLGNIHTPFTQMSLLAKINWTLTPCSTPEQNTQSDTRRSVTAHTQTYSIEVAEPVLFAFSASTLMTINVFFNERKHVCSRS